MKFFTCTLICFLLITASLPLQAQETSAVIIEDDQTAENPLAPIEEKDGGSNDDDNDHVIEGDIPDEDIGDFGELLDSSFMSTLKEYATNQAVIISILNQNKAHEGITDEQIQDLDRQWLQQKREDSKPLITAKLANGLSSFLTRLHAQSNGLFTEVFVMDKNGLNVGQSAITHDYWQGDEDKWINTFVEGNDAMHIGEKTLNEDLQIETVQVSMTVTDPESFRAIGAITFEINLTELQRRKQAGL